jgi:long-chain acyl-CoA synthetase
VAEASRRSPEEIRPDMHLLLDLGIDSIGKVDLLCALESRFGMEIDDETAGRVARVADLLAVVGDRKPREGRRLDPGRRRWWLGGRGIPALSNGRISVPALPLRWVLRGAGHLFMRSYVRVRASGCGHIPSAGPFILAPNHASHLDAPAVLRAVDGRRRIWVAAAEDYFFDTPVKRFVFGRVFDAIAFDRHVDGLQGLRRCGEALARGDGLLIFPEGTRSLTGRLQPFKVGTAALAVEHHAPIIPVYIHNSFDLCPKGRPLPQPGVVTVTFGPPIVPEPFDNETDHVRLYQSLTDRLQSAVAELAGSPGNKSD